MGYRLVRPIKPRILEVIEFSRKMGYKRIALVFCIGLRREAAVVNGIFTNHGLEVISLVCKVGRIPKEAMGIAEEQKVLPGSFEPMCNPVFQARLANHYRSQFNVLLGLCVGHDSLFFKYAEAPCRQRPDARAQPACSGVPVRQLLQLPRQACRIG